MFVSGDKREALLNVIRLENHGNMTANYIQLRGLEPAAIYEDADSGRRYSGSALMEAGIPLPLESGDYLAYQIYFVLKED